MLEGLEKILNAGEKSELNLNGILSVEKIYVQANDIADQILNLYYDGNIRFPVNIRGIVKACDIGIYETNLNVDRGFRVEKVNGYLRQRINGRYDINLQNSDSEFTKRYILAHELSQYFLNRISGDAESYGQNCVDPLFARHQDELLADIMAAFLLFPPECVLKCLKGYTDQMKRWNEYPIDSFDWIRDLGQSAQVSFYFTVICYQYVKFYLCYLYNTKPECDLVSEYREFFK